jgi:outer membrane protein insertion porin family
VFRKLIIIAILFPVISYAANVSRVDVSGNSRISTATIVSYLTMKQGDAYTAQSADESLKALYKTGFFSDVKIESSEGVLKVQVSENPLVNKIAFEGNKKLSDKDLKQEISMTEHSVYSSNGVTADVQRMISLYNKKGRYDVKINPQIIKLDNNRVNLVYEITEGSQSKIRRINFIGNKSYTSRKLSSVIASREYRFYNFFSSDDIYDETRLVYDQELLRRFYMNEGFADFVVSSADTELSSKQDAFILTFAIEEGDIYTYGDAEVQSLIPNIKIDQVKNLIQLKKGAVFNLSQIESDVDSITNFLGDKGYAFVDVDFDLIKDKEAKVANVLFKISEGSKVYINRIDIKNNTRTLDKVIRREFKINEGDPYNQTKLMRSQQRIRDLGFFNEVNFKNIPTEDSNKIDVEVEVDEKPTGSINGGIGYSTADGPIGQIGISESNFLGRGQVVDLSLSKSKKSTNIDFGFTEPYFLDRPLAAGFDVFHKTQSDYKSNSFREKSVGIDLNLGYEVTDHLYHTIHYMIKSDKIYKVPNEIKRYVSTGKYITSMVGHSLAYDRLDDKFSPTKGYRIQISQDFAGVGGNTRYIKHGANAKKYFPVYKKDVVLGLFASAGHIQGLGGKKVRLNDRYFIGSDELRGFDSSGIGPRDKKEGESLGGTVYYIGTAELTFPIGLPADVGVKGASFIDAGTLFGNPMGYKDINYDKSIRASYGLGIIWNSKIVDIRLDYAIPFKKRRYDDTERFRVKLGKSF